MKANKKKVLSFDEKIKNAEQILKGKELNPNGKSTFEKVLKKAVTTKQSDLK
ncbi:MAG TPA: hypothetical protein PK431_11615 [Chitinophagales bacterium]|nr:hypothetical protein [Chitinophagales bacterium]